MHRGSLSPIRRNRPCGRSGATLLLPFLALLLPLLSIPELGHAAVLTSIRVEPAGLTLAPEQDFQFQAIAEFSDGSEQNITAVAEWTTGDSRTAKVSQEHGSRGIVTSRDPGTVEIRAALEFGGSKTKGNTILTVDAGPIIAITTRPSSKNLDVGIAEQFKARAQYTVNDYVGDVTDEVTWSSSDPSKASVDATGLVTPHAKTAEGAPIVITAHHAASGLQNTTADGETTIKAAIQYLYFDEDLENEGGALVVTMGVGMIQKVDVYARRVDGTDSRVTKDIEFEVSGPPGVVFIHEEDEDLGREAGDIEGLSVGLAVVRANDPGRQLTAVADLVIIVAGELTALIMGADPFKATVGEEKTAKITGLLSDGSATRDLRKVLDWTTGNPSIATVGARGEPNVGKVTGHAVGQTTLTATEPSTGVSVTVPIDVRGAFVAVELDPDDITLGVGMYFPLRANGVRSDGSKSTVTTQVTWEITPTGVGIISPAGVDIDTILFGLGDGTPTKGILTTIGQGDATIRAILNAGTPDEIVSPPASLSVEGTLTGVRVRPTNFKVIRDQRRKATLVGDLSTGAVTSNLAEVATWRVDDTAVGLVGNGDDVPDAEDPLDRGEVLALDTGVTTLSATEPISGLTSAEVGNLRVQGDVVEVEVDEASGGVIQAGTPGEYKARATFTDGSKGVISDRCEWSSDDESIATVNNTDDKGMVTGLLIGGKTRIRIDCDGLKANGQVEVAGDIVGLEVSPEVFTGKALATRRFRAAADYVGGARGDATDLVNWSSTNPTVATVDDLDDKGLVRFLADGEAFIVATAVSGHTAIAVVNVSGGVSSVRVVPNSKTIRGSTGRKLRVVAELSDGNQTNVYDATWTTSDPDIARMSDREGEHNVVLGGSKLGTAVVTATLPDGGSGSTLITIDTLLTGIEMRPDRRTIELGKHRRVTARGFFDDGRNKSVTRYVEFISDDPAVAIVQSHGKKPGRVIAIAPGTTTIRAVDPTTGIESSDRTTIEVVAP